MIRINGVNVLAVLGYTVIMVVPLWLVWARNKIDVWDDGMEHIRVALSFFWVVAWMAVLMTSVLE